MFRSLALVLVLAGVGFAQESRKCTCRDGNGSYLYLRCPKSAPADPDPCPAVHDNIHPRKALPKEWNDLCWQSNRMSCFLRRHAASWRIHCSMCAEEKCCPYPNHENCPECHGDAREMPLALKEMIALREEQRKIGGRRIEVAMSPSYVIVSDLRSLKIASAGGGPRIARRHEILHLYLQRAEMARRDFEKAFGSAHHGLTALVVVRSESTRDDFAQIYAGSKVNVVKGYGQGKTVVANAGNSLYISGRNDDRLHFRMRHLIGHLLMSCYVQVQPHEKYLPQWIDKGCAHWLSKLHPRAEDYATFCQHEGVGVGGGGARGGGGGGRRVGGGGSGGPAVSGSGAHWDMKAKKIARRGPRRDPVEAMFQASTAREMDFEMHVRSWSWFDTFLREDPDPFVRFIQGLRRAHEPRAACKDAWGQAPELVDERWRESVLGKRKSVAVTAKEEKETERGDATSRELQDIATEDDLDRLASRIRGLEQCRNVETVRLLLTLADQRRSERVREVIALILERTEDEKVLAYLRDDGFRRADPIGRAILCRVFGRQKDEKATRLLRDALSDSFWLVRANAARSLAQIGDPDAIPALTKMASSASHGKLRIAGMDALAAYGHKAKASVPEFERNLMNPAWQVKVATCDALRAIGNTDAVDLLISRMSAEGGRVHDDIMTTLKALTGNSRDMTQEEWRKWWEHFKKFRGIEDKMREELEKERARPEPKRPQGGNTTARRTTKEPTYYGIKVYARTVGYVLDVSQSMKTGFKVSPTWEARLGHDFKATSRIGVCKEELARSIRDLDPRTRLNLYFFNTRAWAWQSSPVSAGSMGSNAISTVENVKPERQTNYYDALRLVLGMEDEDDDGWGTAFTDTPDTLFFLTDGAPTDGDITKTDELISWFQERNRFARLRVHVIAMGTMGVALEFLPRFAKDNGGTFLHITGTY